MREITVTLSEVIGASGEELRELALDRLLAEQESCQLPTRDGQFHAVGYDAHNELTLTLIHGRPGPGSPNHRHVRCLLGDTFGSLVCGCREHLEDAISEITAAGSGTLVYVRPAGADALACPGNGVAAAVPEAA
ncbi:MAG: hypothetical protein J2O48_13900 [Solirubrobacterales bacterium]|nr:hypothetical protein [Solirubrobacterales bacterium]